MHKFELGRVLATPEAIAAIEPVRLLECLGRHVRGDWGTVCAEDRDLNDQSVLLGNRLLSVYPISAEEPDNVFWIITEADRSVTTVLLPEEY